MMRMNSSSENRSRKTVLALVMLALLGASTVAAWLLVRSREGNVERAHAILATIRQDGLRRYWGLNGETLYYVGRDETGKAVRWQVSMRKPTPDGYKGETYHGNAQSPQMREQWTVSADVSADHYEGILLHRRGALQTRIHLERDSLTVQSGLGGTPVTTALPDNYIPEGLNSLVLQQVARGGAQATFKMIFDQEAVVGGQIHFVQLSLRPQGKNAVQAEFFSFSTTGKTTYFLDGAGQVQKIQMEDVTYERVTRSQFLDEFPQLRNFSWDEDEEEDATSVPGEKIVT